jgi:hypothetical protein
MQLYVGATWLTPCDRAGNPDSPAAIAAWLPELQLQ